MRILLPIILFLVPLLLQAQFINIKLCEANESRSPGGPAVVISRKDPAILVAAYGQYVFHSSDQGKNWERTEINSSFGGDPVLASDRKGMIYNFFLSKEPAGKIICRTSRDEGTTWEEKGSIGSGRGEIRFSRVFMHPKSGEIYLSWTQYDNYGSEDAADKSNIFFSRSKDGKKWDDPILVSQLAGNCRNDDMTTQGSSQAVTLDGLMFVTWAMNQKIIMDRSFNKGSTWLTNDILVADQYGGSSMKIPGLEKCNGMPLLKVDNSPSRYHGTLFLLWADQKNGEDDTDIWFSRSTSYGDNWTPPQRINDDGKGKHQFLPAMCVDQTNGYIYIVYYDRRNYDDEQTDVYLAYSADNGNSFKNVKISEQPFLPHDNDPVSDYINIDAYRGVITPIWSRVDNGKTSVYMTVIKQEDLIKDVSAGK